MYLYKYIISPTAGRV